ncbi:Abcc2 [Scenedesmus sp. PABB004]|nr:Abcc2 [Scenedesmus sp. PABB004]
MPAAVLQINGAHKPPVAPEASSALLLAPAGDEGGAASSRPPARGLLARARRAARRFAGEPPGPDRSDVGGGGPAQARWCPEEEAGWVSRLFFCYANGLVSRGARKHLEQDDLWSTAGSDDPARIWGAFDAELTATAHAGAPRGVVWRSLRAVHGRRFVVTGIIKLGHDCVMFAQPLLLEQLLKHLSTSADRYVALGYAGGLFGAALLEAVLVNVYFHMLFRMSLHTKTALLEMLYRKALDMAGAVRASMGVGPIVNLQSNDAAKLWSLPTYAHMVWNGPFQIVVVMALLVRVLSFGPALAGLGVTVAIIPLTMLLGRLLTSARKEAIAAADQRVKLVTEVITGIKAIKLYAWEAPYLERITALRERELRAIRRTQLLGMINGSIFNTGPVLVSLAAFGTYAALGHPLTAAVAFPSLALFNLLRFPIVMIPQQIMNLIAASVGVARIQGFMDSEQMSEVNHLPPAPPRGAAAPGKAGAAAAANGAAGPPRGAPAAPPPPAVRVAGGSFAWAPGAPPVLHDVSLEVPAGALVLIVGPVGAGKSSLLAALLGEMCALPSAADGGGASPVSVAGSVAYTAQDPWIQNATLRANVLMGLPFDEDRYEATLDAAALRADLEVLPAGDASEIGEKGINLSGGQKHRVALARALYAGADVCLLDDPLSAVDAHVGRHLFEGAICGALRGATRLLVTHQLQARRPRAPRTAPRRAAPHRPRRPGAPGSPGPRPALAAQYLPRADMVVVMDQGRIAHVGTYHELTAAGVDLAAFVPLAAAGEGGEDEGGDGHEGEARELPPLRVGAGGAGRPGFANAKSFSTPLMELPRYMLATGGSFASHKPTKLGSGTLTAAAAAVAAADCDDAASPRAAGAADPTSPGGHARRGARVSFDPRALAKGGGSDDDGEGVQLVPLSPLARAGSGGSTGGAPAAQPQPQAAGTSSEEEASDHEGAGLLRADSGSHGGSVYSGGVASPRAGGGARALLARAGLGRAVGGKKARAAARLSREGSRGSASGDLDDWSSRDGSAHGGSAAADGSARSGRHFLDGAADKAANGGGDKAADGTALAKGAKALRGQLIKAEERAKGQVKRSVYLAYLTAWGPLLLLPTAVALGALAERGLQVLQNYVLSAWSNAVSAAPGASSEPFAGQSVAWYLALYTTLGLASVGLVLARSALLVVGSVAASRTLHGRLLAKMLRLPMSFYDSQPTGRLINRFTKDTEAVDMQMAASVSSALTCIVSAALSIVVVVVVSPYTALALVPLAVLYYRVQRLYIATSRELKRLDALAFSPIFQHYGETLSGLATIRAFGRQALFAATNRAHIEQSNRAWWPIQLLNRWLSMRLELTGAVVVFVTAVAVGVLVPRNAGLAGLAISSALNLTGTLAWMVRQTTELEVNMNSVERLVEYREQAEEAPALVEPRPPAPWPEAGAIQAVQLVVRYRPELPPVLKSLSFSINAREKVGICGRTGCGKSTLMMVLFRMVEPSRGVVLIDGMDTGRLGLADLRSRLSLVPQDPVIFSGTVRSNLDPFGQAGGDDAIWEALRQAGLADLVRSLGAGLDSPIQEAGNNLSCGQRQLLCMARALLRRSRVLVLDEATSNVDQASDALIQATIRSAFGHCTVLTIAHRLHTIADADRVMVLDAGRLREFDAPAALMGLPGGVFRGLMEEASRQHHHEQPAACCRAPRRRAARAVRGVRRPSAMARQGVGGRRAPRWALALALTAAAATVAGGDAVGYGVVEENWRGEVEQLSWSPRAFLFRGFLSDAECEHIIKMSEPKMEESNVVDSATGVVKKSEARRGARRPCGRAAVAVRTSTGTFYQRAHDDVVSRIETRVAAVTMIPVEHQEGLQVLHYKDGQKYEAHYDYFHDDVNQRLEAGGQRVLTVLMYLSTPEEGGETVFPDSPDKVSGPGWSECALRGLANKPRRGDALMFYSLTPDGKKDPLSLHASCPTTKGSKWSATKWIHVSPFGDGAPPRRPTGCADEHVSCASWAASGECDKNAGYMSVSCRLSCKLCDPGLANTGRVIDVPPIKTKTS